MNNTEQDDTMRFVIITGMSGAGKSCALKKFEDDNFFCVDNLPIELVSDFAKISLERNDHRNVAICVDIRSGEKIDSFDTVLDDMREHGIAYEILFLDASDETLIKRFKETRRAHPLAATGRVRDGIELERQKLEFLKKRADYIIDTTMLLVKELRIEIDKVFAGKSTSLFITVMSFGFKYGIPTDVDLVMDVRFMPNPYYVDELKHKTGNDEEVRNYVMNSEVSLEFMERFTSMADFLIPNYIKEGRSQLVIGIGCTGGKHRSVTVANKLYDHFKDKENIGVKVVHRDIYL